MAHKILVTQQKNEYYCEFNVPEITAVSKYQLLSSSLSGSNNILIIYIKKVILTNSTRKVD